MGRAGRKRKSGRRHPSGQLVRVDKYPDDKIRTSRQPHRRTVRADDRLSYQAESPLGRLLLTMQLNRDPTDDDPDDLARARYEAGALYAHVVGEYRSVIEGPRSTGGSGRGFGCPSEHADPIERQVRLGSHVITIREWPCGTTDGGCACARRKARYDSAFEAVLTAGQRAAKAVARVAVHREELAREDLVYLADGLSALARHFGLTGRRRREHS